MLYHINHIYHMLYHIMLYYINNIVIYREIAAEAA